MTMTPAERNLAAERRATTERHRTRLVNGTLRVVSHSERGVRYEVRAHATAVGKPVLFDCLPTLDGAEVEFAHRHRWGQPGVVPCKHSALAAKRLRREGFITKDPEGRWVATAKAVPMSADDGSDVFAGL